MAPLGPSEKTTSDDRSFQALYSIFIVLGIATPGTNRNPGFPLASSYPWAIAVACDSAIDMIHSAPGFTVIASKIGDMPVAVVPKTYFASAARTVSQRIWAPVPSTFTPSRGSGSAACASEETTE